MSHATEVYKASDEMIRVLYTRADGVTYYQLGTATTVSWRGKQFGEERMYLCHTHRVNECECTRRIDKYRTENFA